LRIKCPYCDFEGEAKEFWIMYESVLYLEDSKVEKEWRERPPYIICPSCKNGFFLESPYTKFYRNE